MSLMFSVDAKNMTAACSSVCIYACVCFVCIRLCIFIFFLLKMCLFLWKCSNFSHFFFKMLSFMCFILCLCLPSRCVSAVCLCVQHDCALVIVIFTVSYYFAWQCASKVYVCMILTIHCAFVSKILVVMCICDSLYRQYFGFYFSCLRVLICSNMKAEYLFRLLIVSWSSVVVLRFLVQLSCLYWWFVPQQLLLCCSDVCLHFNSETSSCSSDWLLLNTPI